MEAHGCHHEEDDNEAREPLHAMLGGRLPRPVHIRTGAGEAAA